MSAAQVCRQRFANESHANPSWQSSVVRHATQRCRDGSQRGSPGFRQSSSTAHCTHCPSAQCVPAVQALSAPHAVEPAALPASPPPPAVELPAWPPAPALPATFVEPALVAPPKVAPLVPLAAPVPPPPVATSNSKRRSQAGWERPSQTEASAPPIQRLPRVWLRQVTVRPRACSPRRPQTHAGSARGSAWLRRSHRARRRAAACAPPSRSPPARCSESA